MEIGSTPNKPHGVVVVSRERRPGARLGPWGYVRKYPGLPPMPLYWRDEASGVLVMAVYAYLDRASGKGPTQEQIDLLGDWLHHYIHAPCWDRPDNAFRAELEDLKQRATAIATVQDIQDFVHQAMQLGLDPF